jgi:ankyrin repeat protein
VNGPALTATELEFLHEVLDLARTGSTVALAAAIESGVPVDLTNGAGDSLLILAAYHCRPETVAMLVAHRADTERINDRGQTALAAATFRRDDQIVELLLAAGADPETGSRSARAVAAFFGLTDMTARLARRGATVEREGELLE